MKIGVNARMLAQPFTGVGQYTKNLFIELAKIDKEIEYLLIVPKKVPSKIEKMFPANVEIKVLPEKKFGLAGLSKVWWEQMQVPSLMQKESVDVAFFTYASNPWGRFWYKKGIKTIVTLHDCIPWTEKEYLSGRLSRFYHSKSKKAVALADQVYTVSKFSKEEIVKNCGVKPEKVKVFYNDADSDYKKVLNEGFEEDVLKKYGLKRKGFFLYCGGFDRRKNVHLLLKEYLMFCEKMGGGAIPLVMAGGKLYENYLYEDVEVPLEYQKKVIETGFVENEELAALYRNCAAYVNLSRLEGFNIPVVEAANCGAPLVLSDIEVNREIAGDEAWFVDYAERGATAEVLEQLLDLDIQQKYAEKSSKIVQKYSWSRTAKGIFEQLFKVF